MTDVSLAATGVPGSQGESVLTLRAISRGSCCNSNPSSVSFQGALSASGQPDRCPVAGIHGLTEAPGHRPGWRDHPPGSARLPQQAAGTNRIRRAERRLGRRIAPGPEPPRSVGNPRHAQRCLSTDALGSGPAEGTEVGSVICRAVAAWKSGRSRPGGNHPGRGGAWTCVIALRVHWLSGRTRSLEARGSIPARPLELPSFQPADLLDAPCAAVAAPH